MTFVVTLTNGATQYIDAEEYRYERDFVYFFDANQRKVAAMRASNVKEIKKKPAA